MVTDKLSMSPLFTSVQTIQSSFVEIDVKNIAGSTIPGRRLFVSFESSWLEKWEDTEIETALEDHFTCEYISNTH